MANPKCKKWLLWLMFAFQVLKYKNLDQGDMRATEDFPVSVCSLCNSTPCMITVLVAFKCFAFPWVTNI